MLPLSRRSGSARAKVLQLTVASKPGPLHLDVFANGEDEPVLEQHQASSRPVLLRTQNPSGVLDLSTFGSATTL